MLLKEPYQFKTLKLVNTADVVTGINRYIVTDYAYIKDRTQLKIKPFVSVTGVLNPVILLGLSSIEKDIPVFSHPLINLEHKWIALDLRSVVKPSEDKEHYEVRNESEYNLSIQRYVLSGMWATGKENALYSFQFPHFAYASWLSDNLTKKFGLDLNDQLRLRVLALIYYSTLFTDSYSDDDFTKLIIRCKEDLVIPDTIKEIKGLITKLDTIDDFCVACYDVTKNIRLKGLDFNVLINVLGNNWSGSTGKELAMLSIEHPPTWISLVYASLTQRSFRKSYIATLVEKLDRRGKGEDFIKALTVTTAEYKANQDV